MALGNSVQYAGEYNLEECKLFSSTGVTARLDANVIEFNLFENMFVSGLVASLVIVDQNNLVMNMPIVGQEFISIKLTTKGIGSFDFTENVFCVHRVGARQDASSGAQIYELNLVSPETIKIFSSRFFLHMTAMISSASTLSSCTTLYGKLSLISSLIV